MRASALCNAPEAIAQKDSKGDVTRVISGYTVRSFVTRGFFRAPRAGDGQRIEFVVVTYTAIPASTAPQ